MASRLLVVCSACRRQSSLPADAVLLTTNPNRESARQSFICTHCKLTTVRHADAEEVGTLESAGCRVQFFDEGPALCEDDVIDLMLELESGKWL